MLIGFEFIWDETPLLVEVARDLQAKGHSIVGVTLDNRWNVLLKNTGFELVNLAEYLNENWDKIQITDSLLQQYEEKYGREHYLSFFIYVDRLINTVNRHKFKTTGDKLKLLVLHFDFWEDFFDRYDVDSFYTTGTAFMALFTGMVVAGKRDIHFRAIYATRDSKSRIVFVDNCRDRWKSVGSIYEKLLERELTAEERQFAENYLDEFRNRAAKPAYMKHSWYTSGLRWFYVAEFGRRVVRKFVHKWGRSRFDYVTPPLIRRALKELKVIVKRKLLYMFYFRKDVHSDRNYIFFPLQLQPEASTDVWGMWYANQIATVENISKVLPLNYILCVKEHKVAVGRRKGLFSYYNQLKRIPNVVLVHPLEDSHRLIQGADLVVVVSGTVGWEALLYGKPTVTLGNVFYNDSRLVRHADRIADLKSQIQDLIDNYRLDRDRLLKYIVALREGTYDGYFYVPHCDGRALAGDNISNVANAIIADTGSK